MELNEKDTVVSDDEEDLENLRLAALETLKKTAPAASATDKPQGKNFNQNYGSSNFGKRRRGFHGIRSLKNGQFRTKVRNCNLISIPVVESDALCEKDSLPKDTENVPKLVLPQHRYCNPQLPEKSHVEKSSKFDRYDKSESESDYEEETSDTGKTSPSKLERTNSLEALMQELENEIQGNENIEKVKAKPKKPRKIKLDDAISENVVEKSKSEVKVEVLKPEKEVTVKNNPETLEKKVVCENSAKIVHTRVPVATSKERTFSSKKIINKRSLSPIYPQPYIPYIPSTPYHQVPFVNPYAYENVPYNPMVPVAPPTLPVIQNYVPTYVPPPIPTFGSAPLSPRSAQFVLQNQKIIEKRKMSPRRSYSPSLSPVSPSSHRSTKSERSLSPRPKMSRRSPPPLDRRLSPNRRPYSPNKPFDSPDRTKTSSRHVSPLRNGKSTSRRMSPIRRERTSPKRKLSPNRQLSPSNNNRGSTRFSPSDSKMLNRSPKTTVYDRLGAKKGTKRSRSLSVEKELPKQTQVQNDPVLEARKRKFESGQIPKEGIIRLKQKSEDEDDDKNSKEDDNSKNEDSLDFNEQENDEDLLDDDILIDTKIDDIFPEEESDEENEGRFKSSNGSQKRNVSVVPFTKLINSSSLSSKKNHLNSRKNTKKEDNSSKDRRVKKSGRHDKVNINSVRTDKSQSPLQVQDDKSTSNHRLNDVSKLNSIEDTPKSIISGASKSVLKGRVMLKGNLNNKQEKRVPVSAILENKKIEIKIRNPSKYEGDKQPSYNVLNKDQLEERERVEMKISRKVVELTKEKEISDYEDTEPEIIVDYEQNEDDEKDVLNKNKGDLRAQLSRKRAERQKIPLESVQSRLLQNALEGAVYKKDKKSKSKKKSKESAPKEAKLPIHMRLGIPKDETTSKRKRNKNRSNVDQE